MLGIPGRRKEAYTRKEDDKAFSVKKKSCTFWIIISIIIAMTIIKVIAIASLSVFCSGTSGRTKESYAVNSTDEEYAEFLSSIRFLRRYAETGTIDQDEAKRRQKRHVDERISSGLKRENERLIAEVAKLAAELNRFKEQLQHMDNSVSTGESSSSPNHQDGNRLKVSSKGSSLPLNATVLTPTRNPNVAHGQIENSTVAKFERLKEDLKKNIHKPKFEHCAEYRPEVEEESQIGKQVIQVGAIDQDGPNTPKGQVTYSIVSQNSKFTIDPRTGWLSTNAIFNRDKPNLEKLVHVMVKATDNGQPQLEDLCMLAVKIKDTNDNAPVFDHASYYIKIPKDMAIGEHIMSISASDIDQGENQEITYNLSAFNHPSDIEYFKWHYQTGEVILNAVIDKPIDYIFQFIVTATDQGSPPKYSTILANLEVKESLNMSPTFVDSPGLSIVISEGFSDFSTPIASYTARSNIPNEETVFFQLLSGQTEQTNKGNTFRAVQSQNSPNTVHIFLDKTLEYEKISMYTLTLEVQNIQGLFAEVSLSIFVKDENNQSPIFNNIDIGNVLEHEPAGTIVMQVSAVDYDGTYPNNKVSYKISDKNPKNVRIKFSIDPNTGVVTTNEEFDREEQNLYALIIDAKDGAPKMGTGQNGKPNLTSQKFRIVIADKNDNPPYFPQQLYRAEVPEDEDVGSKVIKVHAEDNDKEVTITYQIMSGNEGQAFRIEERTGILKVAKPLDYETTKKYVLVIGAWDGQFGNKTAIEISILNVNDMKPLFQEDQYIVKLQEDEVPSYPIITISAIDPDIGDDTVEQNITYFLDQSSNIAEYFSIDAKTGDVRMIKKLDQDATNVDRVETEFISTRSLYIFAKDENGGSKGLENYVELILILEGNNRQIHAVNMDN